MLVSEKTYEQAVSYINEHEEVICDTETTGLDWVHDDKVCGIGLMAGETPYYFPFRHEEPPNLPESLIKDICDRVLKPERLQVGFHYGFDIKMLSKEGMQMPKRIECSLLSAHLLNENEESFKMENLATKYINSDAGKEEEELIDLLVDRFGGGRKSAKGNLWRLSAAEVEKYACRDLITTRKLRDLHASPLNTWKIEGLYRKICEYQLAIVEMEMAGVLLDTDLIKKNIDEAVKHTDSLEGRAAELAEHSINLRSSKQTQEWLNLKSTARAILEPMAERGDERAQLLLDHRVWSKVKGTYYSPFLQGIDANNRLHTNLRLTGTVTGRLSCSKPNLQSIPRGSDVYKVKNVFIASPDHVLIEADYSQIEVRVMAHYTRDPKLIEIISSGASIHSIVAKEQNLPYDVAKRLNFSAQYGIGPNKFAKTYGYSLKDSREYLRRYHSMFPGMRRLYNAADRRAKRGYITHYTGRVRHFNDSRRAPTHKASSNLIQGAVAEILRIAITRLRRELGIKMWLTVHDSIEFEVLKNDAKQLIPEIRRIMKDQSWCTIPITTDIKIGPSWGNMQEVPCKK